MTIYTLIEKHQELNPHSHYFDADTLRFFGERKSEMRVLKDTVTVTGANGDKHEAWCVSALQRKAPGGPKRSYTYFDTQTFKRILM